MWRDNRELLWRDMFEIVVTMDSIKAATWLWQQMEEGPQDLGKKNGVKAYHVKFQT